MSKNVMGIMEFSNGEFGVAARESGGNIEFVIDNVARSLGFVQTKKGKEYVRRDRVNEHLTEFGFPHQLGKGDFIPEQYVYLLAMKANNNIAIKFQKWLAFDVIPKIRKHGAYIDEDADVDYVNNELRFSKGRTIKTFANASVAEIGGLYKDFTTYVNDEYKYDSNERVARYKSVEKGLDRLHIDLAKDVTNIGNIYNVQRLKERVIIDRTTLEKRISGGKKSGQTKQIARLEDELENSMQPYRESEFCVVDYHGFSNNYMYDYSHGRVHKSLAYSRWIQNFPYSQVPDIEDWWCDVNWNKPIEMIIHYTCKDSADVHNLDKATIDMIISRIYGYNDAIVKSVKSKQVANCCNYSDGKIGFFIRNI